MCSDDRAFLRFFFTSHFLYFLHIKKFYETPILFRYHNKLCQIFLSTSTWKSNIDSCSSFKQQKLSHLGSIEASHINFEKLKQIHQWHFLKTPCFGPFVHIWCVMVIAWIQRSILGPIVKLVLWFNIFYILDVQEDLYHFLLGIFGVSVYFTQLKVYWGELEIIDPFHYANAHFLVLVVQMIRSKPIGNRIM